MNSKTIARNKVFGGAVNFINLDGEITYLVEDCIFNNNFSLNSGTGGGAISYNNALVNYSTNKLLVYNCEFVENLGKRRRCDFLFFLIFWSR